MEKDYNPLEDLLGIEPEEVDAVEADSISDDHNPLEDLLGFGEDEQENAVQQETVQQETIAVKEEDEYNPLEDLESDNFLIPEEDSTEYDLDVEKTFDEFSADEGYIDSIKEYAESRYGERGIELLKDKSNE